MGVVLGEAGGEVIRGEQTLCVNESLPLAIRESESDHGVPGARADRSCLGPIRCAVDRIVVQAEFREKRGAEIVFMLASATFVQSLGVLEREPGPALGAVACGHKAGKPADQRDEEGHSGVHLPRPYQGAAEPRLSPGRRASGDPAIAGSTTVLEVPLPDRRD